MSRLLALLPLYQDTDSAVQLQADARADLLMWDQFLCDWNRISMFIHPPTTVTPRVFSGFRHLSRFFSCFWVSVVSRPLAFDSVGHSPGLPRRSYFLKFIRLWLWLSPGDTLNLDIQWFSSPITRPLLRLSISVDPGLS